MARIARDDIIQRFNNTDIAYLQLKPLLQHCPPLDMLMITASVVGAMVDIDKRTIWEATADTDQLYLSTQPDIDALRHICAFCRGTAYSCVMYTGTDIPAAVYLYDTKRFLRSDQAHRMCLEVIRMRIDLPHAALTALLPECCVNLVMSYLVGFIDLNE